MDILIVQSIEYSEEDNIVVRIFTNNMLYMLIVEICTKTLKNIKSRLNQYDELDTNSFI